jgi:GntR family transcriptional regulator
VTREDGRPRHQQIAADLRALIMSGELRGKLPTTHELMETYGVGSPTVQRAIQVLKDEGFAEGRRGSGVFAVGRVAIDSVVYIPAEHGYAYQLLGVAEMVPPAEVREAFGIGADDTAVLRHRLMTLHGVPVELSWSYYPAGIAAGTPLTERKRIKGGASELLAQLGHTPVRYEERITARLPTTAELELLELPDDVPVLRQFRILFAANDQPVEATVMVKGGHRYEERVTGQV